MDKQKYIEDLQEIKEMMSRSSRFLSLSGLSGVLAGVVAILAAFAAYKTVYAQQDYLSYRRAILTTESLLTLLAIGLMAVILAVGGGILFSSRKARKKSQPVWNIQTKRMLANLLIPLVSGGILTLLLLLKGYVGLVAPLTLIFYGLALVQASHFTLKEVKSLGILEIALGLLATYFIGYGLLFWVVGFGLLHIIYGVVMEIKHPS
jgi:predicted lysophospholipase L1 biosynthesis ABC-type transport system permease subunit